MTDYKSLPLEAKKQLLDELTKKIDEYKKQDLHLDMSRGKPGAEQLDLSQGLLRTVADKDHMFSKSGMDCRNYGFINGVPEARILFGAMMEVPAENVIVGGNSSLNMMYDAVCRGFTHGYDGCEPWYKVDGRKFLCPSPGYDRHFRITESFGFELITVPMLPTGPDMDMVEKLVKSDDKIKGIWCVPKYSNPDGFTYSDETVKRFAKLQPAAKDFKIFWDNAYCIHDLYENGDKLLSLYDACMEEGTEDMLLTFCSTSKITFPGSGVAAMAGSAKTMEYTRKVMSAQTIGPDKINQLAHVRYLKDLSGCKAYMKKHAAILRPRFEVVMNALDSRLISKGFGSYIRPKGGYFISYYAPEHCAKEIVSLCKNLGVVFTDAGATYPYGIDPKDSNIRLAPSYPSVDDLKKAIDVFCTVVQTVALQKEITQ